MRNQFQSIINEASHFLQVLTEIATHYSLPGFFLVLKDSLFDPQAFSKVLY